MSPNRIIKQEDPFGVQLLVISETDNIELQCECIVHRCGLASDCQIYKLCIFGLYKYF